MAMKTILVPIPDTAVDAAAIETALKVTKAVAGHLEGLYIETPPPPRTAALAGYETPTYGRPAGGMQETPTYGRPAGGMPPVEVQLAREAEARERAAEQARAEFRRLCAAHGVPVGAPDAFGQVPSASWGQVQGDYAGTVTARAPAHDLMVVPNPGTAAARDIAEHILLDTGRPVLLAPAQAERDPSGAALIAWYPSLQAWRAVAAAVPLLARARRVEIVSVGEDEAAVAGSRAEVVRYLGWHGITATARPVEPLARSVGDVLLHEASEAQAGMLVMGAYSHSRLRELLLGGVTRHVLANVAATPVFMAH